MATCSASRQARQRGVALLLLAVVLVVFATTWLVSGIGGTVDGQVIEVRTTQAIAQAKEALIARAVNDDNLPGSLPCPDLDGDGEAEGLTGNKCPSYLGRFPYMTLNSEDLRDGHGERLWYALSSTLRDHPSARPINANTAADISLDGNSNVAAIIFAPGPPLPHQGGRPGNLVSDYLDGSNSDGNSVYVSGPAGDAFNDRAVPLTWAELFAAVSKRVLGEVRGPDDRNPDPPWYGLRAYHNDHHHFPWADSDGDGRSDGGKATGKLPYADVDFDPDPPNWLNDNAWLPLVDYTRVSASRARIAIGSASLEVVPCPTSPCP